jgi:hypothetical protein
LFDIRSDDRFFIDATFGYDRPGVVKCKKLALPLRKKIEANDVRYIKRKATSLRFYRLKEIAEFLPLDFTQ